MSAACEDPCNRSPRPTAPPPAGAHRCRPGWTGPRRWCWPSPHPEFAGRSRRPSGHWRTPFRNRCSSAARPPARSPARRCTTPASASPSHASSTRALRRAFTDVDGAADSFDAGARLAAQLAGRRPARGVRAVRRPVRQRHALVDGLARHLPRRRRRSPAAWPATAAASSAPGCSTASSPRRTASAPSASTASALRVGHGCDGGWHDFGPERRITRSDGQRALRARRQAGARPLQDLPRRARRRPARHRAAVPARGAREGGRAATRSCARSSASTKRGSR